MAMFLCGAYVALLVVALVGGGWWSLRRGVYAEPPVQPVAPPVPPVRVVEVVFPQQRSGDFAPAWSFGYRIPAPAPAR